MAVTYAPSFTLTREGVRQDWDAQAIIGVGQKSMQSRQRLLT
jgi:hypothetical protein